jgi:hypothetical protein
MGIIALLSTPCSCKVKIKSDFLGFNAQSQKSAANLNLGTKLDLSQVFDLSKAKNPIFTVKNGKHGQIWDTNTKLDTKVLLDRKHILHRTVGSHIGLVTVRNELVLIETKNSGSLGESVVFKLLDKE